MAEGQDFQTCREIFVGGRARALLNTIAYFEMKGDEGEQVGAQI